MQQLYWKKRANFRKSLVYTKFPCTKKWKHLKKKKIDPQRANEEDRKIISNKNTPDDERTAAEERVGKREREIEATEQENRLEQDRPLLEIDSTQCMQKR